MEIYFPISSSNLQSSDTPYLSQSSFAEFGQSFQTLCGLRIDYKKIWYSLFSGSSFSTIPLYNVKLLRSVSHPHNGVAGIEVFIPWTHFNSKPFWNKITVYSVSIYSAGFANDFEVSFVSTFVKTLQLTP